MAASVDTSHRTSDTGLPDYDVASTDGSERVKVICLGDSAVGKSKYDPPPPGPPAHHVEYFIAFGFLVRQIKGIYR